MDKKFICRYWEIGHHYMNCKKCKTPNSDFCGMNYGMVVPKGYCDRCRKPIYKGMKQIDIEGKTPKWDYDTKKWTGTKYYHPECLPIIINGDVKLIKE